MSGTVSFPGALYIRLDAMIVCYAFDHLLGHTRRAYKLASAIMSRERVQGSALTKMNAVRKAS